MKYLLATYVDAPYWRSALEIMLYPTGCSFYRPFSYRREWAAADITETPPEGPLGDGVLGMRFRDRENKGTGRLFIPLRRIDAICIRRGHEFHLDLRLGPYIHHSTEEQFTPIDLSVKIPETYSQNPQVLLASVTGQFESELNELPDRPELPSEVWTRFIKDPNIAHEALKNLGNATVLQLVSIRQRASGNEVLPQTLESPSRGVHARSGYRLEVGKVYDVELIHRTLTAAAATRQLKKIAYECLAPTERIRVSRPSIPQTGNYREERIWIQPRAVEPAPTEVEWEPTDEESPERTRPDGAVPLRIPFMAISMPWYQFRPGRLWIGLGFTLLAAAFFSLAVCTASDENSNWPAVWVALGAVSAPIGVTAIGRWWDERESQEA